MTEKEFSKLKRHELLQLLLAQGREQKQLTDQLAQVTEQLEEMEVGNARLKERLDDKDAQIERLKKRLDNKDAQIVQLREQIASREILLEEAGSIAEASLRLNHVFEAAQAAIDQYTENVRLRYKGIEDEIARREADCSRRCEALKDSARRSCKEIYQTAMERRGEQERKDS